MVERIDLRLVGHKAPEHPLGQEVLKERRQLGIAPAARHGVELGPGHVKPEGLLLCRVVRAHGLREHIGFFPGDAGVGLIGGEAQDDGHAGLRIFEETTDALAVQFDDEHRNVHGRPFGTMVPCLRLARRRCTADGV
ncbi:hypothetical protein D9M68_825110 [compost metagenome]